jgi:hypothetical protein
MASLFEPSLALISKLALDRQLVLVDIDSADLIIGALWVRCLHLIWRWKVALDRLTRMVADSHEMGALGDRESFLAWCRDQRFPDRLFARSVAGSPNRLCFSRVTLADGLS